MRVLALCFELASGLDSFESRRDSDQDPFLGDTTLGVESQEVVGVLEDGVGVAGGARVDLCRDGTGDTLGEQSADVGEGRVDPVTFGRGVREGALDGDLEFGVW